MSGDVTAFVLISTHTGQELEALNAIRKMKRVKEAYITYGDYDIIAKVQGPDLEAIDNTVKAIRRMREVMDSCTLICTKD